MPGMDKVVFVHLADTVLKALGTTTQDGRVTDYADEVIKIRSVAGYLDLEVERVENRNPITMVAPGGEIIRHHGEHAYVTNHLEGLAAGVIGATNTMKIFKGMLDAGVDLDTVVFHTNEYIKNINLYCDDKVMTSGATKVAERFLDTIKA